MDFEEIEFGEEDLTDEELLAKAKAQIANNLAINKYIPLTPTLSFLMREFYKSEFTCPLDGYKGTLKNKSGTILGYGYERIVVGDYGAYAEMTKSQVCLKNIKNKFSSVPTRKIKYTWMVTRDWEETKVYEQHMTVKYADYKPNMYYISALDLVLES